MANYKTANQLPILEEVTENTFALVEENGSLKRVSGSNLGGKGGCCVISADMGNAVPSSAEGTDDFGIVYTCNMDYAELMEALQNKTLTGFNFIGYMGTQIALGQIYSAYFGSDAPGIMISWALEGMNGHLAILPDNTISAGPGDS